MLDLIRRGFGYIISYMGGALCVTFLLLDRAIIAIPISIFSLVSYIILTKPIEKDYYFEEEF